MWHGRHAMTAALLAVFAVGCAPAAARAQVDPGASDAAVAAQRAAVGGASFCGGGIRIGPANPSLATPTPEAAVSFFRPRGYDVAVDGTTSSGAAFRSRWLVSGGKASPQSIEAARLAAGCDDKASLSPPDALSWHRLPYIDPSTGEVSLRSSLAWGPGRILGPLVSNTRYGPGLREPMLPLWAAKCSSGVQTVRFTRTVWMLGPPQSARVSMASVSRNVGPAPFASMQLFVNGSLVARRLRGNSVLVGNLPPRALGRFVFGPNRLELIIVKKRTGSCNVSRRGRLVAVVFQLDARQVSRLTVTRPAPTSIKADPANPLAAATVPYTLTNNGPSTLLEPVFAYDLRAGASESFPVIGTVRVGGLNGSSDCTTAAPEAQFACALAPMAPGTTRTL